MHIHKLKIGVLLENYKKEEGGAHSYYNTLIEGIANYRFDEGLEFVFVNIGKSIDPSAPNKSYSFDVDHIVKNRYPLFSFLNKISLIKGVNYFPLSNKIQLSYKKRFNETIKEQLIQNEIDVVYSLTPYYKDLNYPTVITHWDIGHKSTFALPEVTFNGEHEFREDYYKCFLQKAFAIVCESEAGKKELCYYQDINPDRIFVMPMFPGNMIELNVPEIEVKEILNKFSIKKNDFFVYPAQFWAHKNHFNLVMAFYEFSKRHNDSKLLLPGSNKGNLEYIKEVVKELKIEEKVIFAGFVSNEELNTFYKNAVALVMPTLMGPTNMPLLEAQALGCQVICSDFPGHRESLGNEAIFINPEDTGDILQAMEKCYLNINNDLPPNRNHTIERSLKEINKIFKRLLPIRRTFALNFKVLKCFLGFFVYHIDQF
jgi:glycosyltransferase involved in cell wall biosynthesis